jgi:hypothetical protein
MARFKKGETKMGWRMGKRRRGSSIIVVVSSVIVITSVDFFFFFSLTWMFGPVCAHLD